VFTDFSGRSKGCGIVEFDTVEEAQKAIDELNDTELEGRKVFIREVWPLSWLIRTKVFVAAALRHIFVGHFLSVWHTHLIQELDGTVLPVIAQDREQGQGRSAGAGAPAGAGGARPDRAQCQLYVGNVC
jgi:RNA recognition motif-containing protein